MARPDKLITALKDWGLMDNFSNRVALGSAALTCDRKRPGGSIHYLVDCAIGLVDEVHRTKEGQLRVADLQALALNLADVMEGDPGMMVVPRSEVTTRADIDG